MIILFNRIFIVAYGLSHCPHQGPCKSVSPSCELTVELQSDLVGVCRPILIGGDALILCLILFWIVPGVDVQRPWAPAHRGLGVTGHVEVLPITPPRETSPVSRKWETGQKNQRSRLQIRTSALRKNCISSYIGWGFPLASHSMTMVSLESTICSFIDCFIMVGGCRTAGRETCRLYFLEKKVNRHILR